MKNPEKDRMIQNIPSMSVRDAVHHISSAYREILNKGLPLRIFPSVMMWGPPGVGKSQAVRQIAESIRLDTSKDIRVTDVRLLLFNPIDLRGIPTANADKTLAVWLKPKIFEMDPSDSTVNILFLDEISAAPQSVQAAAYQITLDRVIGEHRLPENCIVLAAGNRTTDRSVAYKMPRALANRLLHLDIRYDFDSWREWAIRKGVHEKVIGFLAFRPSFLMVEEPGDDLAFATPRSWEMVSNLLCGVSDDIKAILPLISGLVGQAAAREFLSWAHVYGQLPPLEKIFHGQKAAIPKNADALYALVSSIVSHVRNHTDDLEAIENSIRYAEQLPPDFSALLLSDFIHLDESFRKTLMTIPEFNRWLRSKGEILNGAVE